jgi:transcriptional antiterminator NusG
MSMRWYIVHAYSNFEKKVSRSIREQAKQRGLEDLFEQVLVPTEKVTKCAAAARSTPSASSSPATCW